MENSDLASRMKRYECASKGVLINRMPVIIRLDGRSFHTFTKGFKKPFDDLLIETMQETMKYLCENIQGCVLGYTQSDEITLVLVDYKELNTSAWFDNEIQKMCSISASMATMVFNKIFNVKLDNLCNNYYLQIVDIQEEKLLHTYYQALNKGAMFDSRCFNIPKDEVTNCLYWRQLDASRNSIQMLGQANFSHSQLHKKTCNMIQDMLMAQKDINWNDIETYKKRGSCCVKVREATHFVNEQTIQRMETHWIIDKDIPIFKGDGREYIEKLININ